MADLTADRDPLTCTRVDPHPKHISGPGPHGGLIMCPGVPQNAPAAADWSWQDDPDVVSWDWRQGPDLDELRQALARHGVTLTEVETGTDDVAVRIAGPEPQTPPARVIHDRPGDFAGLMAAARAAQDRHSEPADPPSVAVAPPAAPGAGTDTREAAERDAALREALQEDAEIDAIHRAEPADEEVPDWLQAIGHLPFRFWGCPVEGHSSRRAPDGSPVATVEWDGEVARCTFPGCGRTSADTPEAHSGAGLILGRALLDRDGDLWRERASNQWQYAELDPRTRAMVDEVYGPVREVLLVPVEAGLVLEAAWQWTRAWDADPFGPATSAAKARLAAAVDAATSRQPTAKLATTSRGLATEEPTPAPEFVFDSDHAGNLWIGCGTCHSDLCEVGEGDTLAAVLGAVRGHRCDPTKPPRRRTVRCSCGAPLVAENAEEWAHQTEDGYGNDGCDEPLPIADFRDQMHQDLADAEGRADRAEFRCIELQAELQWARPREWAAALRWWTESSGRSPHPSTVADQIEACTLTPWADQPHEAAPEPAGDGPGWDRCGIDHLIAMMDGHARTERGEMPVTVNDADQLRALLSRADQADAACAERDRIIEQAKHTLDMYDRGTDELHAARAELAEVTAELAEVTAERDRLSRLADRQYQSICVLADERDQAQRETG